MIIQPSAAVAFQLLADYFESETRAIHFMEAFAGVTFKVPPMEVVERLRRDRQIVRALNRDPSKQTVRRLADVLGTDARGIAKRFTTTTGQCVTKLRQERQGSSGVAGD